jgi:hypothetical protein
MAIPFAWLPWNKSDKPNLPVQYGLLRISLAGRGISEVSIGAFIIIISILVPL